METAFREVRRRAAREGWRARARMWQRWTGTPFAAVGAAVPREGRVVDLGCGFGLFAALLALDAPARRVAGLDVDEGKVRRARDLFGDLAAFTATDLDRAPLPEADTFVVYDVLHHLADPDALLRRAAAALPPGGRLVVKENDVEPLGKRVVSELVEVVATGSGLTRSAPVRFRSRPAWTAALEAAGLRVERAEHLRAREGFFVPHALFVAVRA